MNALEETRTKLLYALAEVSRLRPQWRLGQLVANLATTAGRLDSGGFGNSTTPKRSLRP